MALNDMEYATQAVGTRADAAATDSTSEWTVVALLKGIWAASSVTPKPFAAKDNGAGAGKSLAVTATSGTLTLDGAYPQVMVFNEGPALAFVRFGSGALTATPADLFLPPQTVQTLTKGSADKLAAITASGTANLRVIEGTGS